MESGHTDVVGYLTGSFDGPALHTLVVPAWQQEGQHQQRNWPQTKPQPHAWQYGDDQSSTIIDSLNPRVSQTAAAEGEGEQRQQHQKCV